MTRRQLAVPIVAALLGSAVTAAAMVASGDSTGAITRQQGLLSLDPGAQMTAGEIYERAAPAVVAVRAQSVQPGAFQADAGLPQDQDIARDSDAVKKTRARLDLEAGA